MYCVLLNVMFVNKMINKKDENESRKSVKLGIDNL